jgi:hypothetical protein
MSGALIVAIIAVSVSALSLLVALGSLTYARRANRRAERGQLSARYLGCKRSPDRVAYRFQVTNVGVAGARHAVLHLRDADGNEVASSRQGRPMVSGEQDEFEVVDSHPERQYKYPLRAHLVWFHWERDEENVHVSRQEIAP